MKSAKLTLVALFAFISFLPARQAQAQAEPFLGQIMWVPYTFCPRGWAEADGQIVSIAQNTALFSLIGTTYGGNGQTTFALPDLRGRVSIHTGQGPGLSDYELGETGGQESVSLGVNQMPAHSHSLTASSAAAAQSDPAGKVLAKSGTYRSTATSPVVMNPASVGVTGGSLPHENRQPFLTLRACIAIAGIFPSRN